MLINFDQLIPLQKRNKDEVGKCFYWNGKIIRGIYPSYADLATNFFKSGFLKELIDNNLFPSSHIVDYTIDGFDLVIEHEKIWPVIYPQEWTFEMLKDAALTTVLVAKIARKYSYNMKDCHGLNILFDGTIPIFIDLGSFFFDKSNNVSWHPFLEFMRFYYYPLQLWGKGNAYIAKLSIFFGNLMPPSEYYLYKYPIIRIFDLNTINIMIKVMYSFSQLAITDKSKLNKIRPAILRASVLFFKNLIDKGFIKPLSCNLERLSDNVAKLQTKSIKTIWGKYQSELTKKQQRFTRIIELINKMKDIETAADIGGNEGVFSSLLIDKTQIKKVLCIDADENAITNGYRRIKKLGQKGITFANFDFMAPIVKLSWEKPNERFFSDIAIALAITHHLILSQKYDLDYIFTEIKSYARKYVLIEFMPLGLWVTGKEVDVPDWYTIDWFRESFCNHFKLIHEEKIGVNYVLFFGSID